MTTADILVVDVSLPNGGTELIIAQWLAKNGGPIIVLDTATGDESMLRYLRIGVDVVLPVLDLATLHSLLGKFSRRVEDSKWRITVKKELRRLRLVVAAETMLLIVTLLGIAPTAVPTLITFLVSLF